MRFFIFYILFYFNFSSKTILFLKKKKKNLFFKKKNLFFKKKYNIKTVISKRLSLVLKKKKNKKKNKKNSGNFFFKKFFYKTLLFCRKNLMTLFFNFKNIRQKKLTKKIQKKTKFFFYKNFTHDYSLVNILIKGGFFLFPKDAVIFIKSNNIYINGVFVNSCDYSLCSGDCIQVQVFDFFYIYLLIFKKFIKYKVSNFKQSSWLFFKKNFLKKTNTVKKFKKRKKPKFLYLLYLYKFNTPQYLEVDFITLSIVLLKKLNIVKHKTYFLNKNFSWKLFQLYNFKKIN